MARHGAIRSLGRREATALQPLLDLLPAEQRKDQRQDQADHDAGNNGKVEGEISALNPDISG